MVQGYEPEQRLAGIFRQVGIWEDTDGDGAVDECRAVLVLGRENSPRENLGCLDVAAALGLACFRFAEPVSLTDDDPELEAALRAGRIPVVFGRRNRLYERFRREKLMRLLLVGDGEVLVAESGALLITGRTGPGVLLAARQLARQLTATPSAVSGEKAEESLAYVLNHLAYRDSGKKKSLGNLFAPGLPDRVPNAGAWVFRLVLPQNAQPDLFKAAAEFSARIGLEAPDLAFPLGYLDGEYDSGNGFGGGDGPAGQTGVDFLVRPAANGGSTGHIRMMTDIRTTAGPVTPRGASPTAIEVEVGGGGEAGVIGALHYLAHRYPLLEPAESSALFYTLRDLELEAAAASGDRGDAAGAGAEFDATWSSNAELTRLWTLWENTVLPRLRRVASDRGSGGEAKVRVELRASYSASSRERVRRRLLASLAGHGIKDAEVIVYPVHKQGLDWIRQTVLPKLTAIEGKRVARLEIEFRRLSAPPGETYLDLPIRWLQELYPADELIAAQLGISTEKVRFLMRESGPTYRVTAFDEEGQRLASFSFEAAYSERFYLEEYKELGKVHPPTGCLRVSLAAVGASPARGDDAETIVDERLATDVEDFWQWYQESFLRELGHRLRRQPEQVREAMAGLQPFFDRAELDVECDGDDFPLGIREERLSPLESLHEDLYFVTLDYFAALGRELCGSPFRAPGGVWPDVRPSRDGEFRARIRVTPRSAMAATDGWSCRPGRPAVDGVGAFNAVDNDGCRVVALVVDGGANLKTAEFETGLESGRADADADRERLARALVGVNELRRRFGSVTSLVVGEGPAPTVVVSQHAPQGGDEVEKRSSDNGRVIITTELLESELIRLGGLLKGRLRVRPMGVSLRGRRCYAVEAIGGRPPHVDGRVKHGRRKPTLLINARHHANEVSSTSAVLRLLAMCAGDGVSGKFLDEINRVNLVVVPMENVDGVAVHEKLQEDHPTWSLHAARFNALGSEFYQEYFNPGTAFGEARVLPQLWWEWQPRVVIDAHGVPSHEWVQEFAGHNSGPSFPVSYWLPGALFYGIESLAAGESTPLSTLQGRLKDAIIAAINENEQIRRLNERWLERYQKYAADWCPDKFPVTVTSGVMFLSRPPKPDGPTFQERFETAVENGAVTLRPPVQFVFEVADETAQGHYLELCAQAHLTGMLAVLKMLVAGTGDSLAPASRG